MLTGKIFESLQILETAEKVWLLQNHRERVFDDVLVREGVTTHYLPLSPDGEKGIDVWLALEAMELALFKRFNVVVLVVCDGDFLPLVRKLNTLGTRVAVLAWDFQYVDGNGNDRPFLLDPSVLGRTAGHPDESRGVLPRSAFLYMQPTDLAGNLGRNTFRKGGIRNVNAAVSRSWRIVNEHRITFRAESVNLFNTPQFADPGVDLANPNFGQITNTLNDGRAFRCIRADACPRP